MTITVSIVNIISICTCIVTVAGAVKVFIEIKKAFMKPLNEIDAKLLTLRYGLEGGLPMNAEEVGRRLGLTPDEVTAKEAAALAAFYSKVKEQDKVEVDYTLRKNVKKPAGGAPGFVVYYTNYSMIAVPKIEHLQPVKE